MNETNFGIDIDEKTIDKINVDNGIREKKHLFTIQMVRLTKFTLNAEN